MKINLIAGYAGIFICIIAGILPIAEINSIPVTILPVFDNMNIGGEIWLWRNISAFVMTYYLSAFTGIYFITKSMRTGIFSVTAILGINSLFILLVLWMTQLEAGSFRDLSFNYSYGWFVILVGIGLNFWAGLKTKKKE